VPPSARPQAAAGQLQNTERVLSTKDSDAVAKQFPKASPPPTTSSSLRRRQYCRSQGKRVAVLFSGGPAAGGHNVVCGLKRVLGAGNTLLGVKAGPEGPAQGLAVRNHRRRRRLRSSTPAASTSSVRTAPRSRATSSSQGQETCIKHNLDAIVVVGGDDSNTNAAVLAESLYTGVKADGSGVQVIGVPKTIDGDLQIGDLLAISFGFDTATRIYSEMVGNILQDTSSSLKYWHFVKLMGRSASHVAIEVALQTKPAITIISEEIAEKKMSLASIIDQHRQDRRRRTLAQGHELRRRAGPEGLIEFIPEMNAMIAELNDVLAHHATELCRPRRRRQSGFHREQAQRRQRSPAGLAAALHRQHAARRARLARQPAGLADPHRAVADRHDQGRVKELDAKVPFAAHSHFLGYEGRCGAPTLFDAAYTYNLGLTAGSLILDGRTGYMATITGLTSGGV
jgi:pyrophosphate--fructose-6-phosphate 1-phosphotransferase